LLFFCRGTESFSLFAGAVVVCTSYNALLWGLLARWEKKRQRDIRSIVIAVLLNHLETKLKTVINARELISMLEAFRVSDRKPTCSKGGYVDKGD